MSSIIERMYRKHSVLGEIKDQKKSIAELNGSSGKRVNSLDELASDLGIWNNGGFYFGNGKAFGDGLTGVFFGYPGLTFNGVEFNVCGIQNDVLQAGFNVDGELVFGGGEGWLDANGLQFNKGNGFPNSISWYDGSTAIAKIYGYQSAGHNLLRLDSYEGATSANIEVYGIGSIYLIGDNLLSLLGPVVINDNGSDFDTRIETVHNTNALVVNAGDDTVEISAGFVTPPVTRTISGGVLDVTGVSNGAMIFVNGQGGAADDLDQITGFKQGQHFWLTRGDANITVKDVSSGAGSPNLNLAGGADFSLGDNTDKLYLIARNSTNIDEVSRSNN